MDTAVKSINRLKEAGFKEDQAKVIAALLEEKERISDLGSINKYYLSTQIISLKNEMIMWMVGLLIVVSGFLFMVLNQRINSAETSLNQRMGSVETSLNQRIDDINQRIDDVNQRIGSLEKHISENRTLIQQVLDNQNKARSN